MLAPMRLFGVMVTLVACGPPGRVTPEDAGTMEVVDAPWTYPRCDAPATFADPAAPSRVLHVVPGAPSGGDGSVAAPFATVEAAAAVATPGTLIQLASGSHSPDQFVSDLRGTATDPIWIAGDPSQARAVIEGGGEALHLTRPAYVVIEHLEIRGQSANGINIDDGSQRDDETAAHHVLVRDVAIHDVGGTGNQDCLKVSGVNELFVYDSFFARCGGGAAGSAIDHVGCHRAVIARNVFADLSGSAVQAKGGSTDIDIRQNRVHDGGERVFNLGGSTGFEFFRPSLSVTAPNAEARRIRAFNNIITGSTGTPFAFAGCVDCLVAHNLMLGTPRWLVRILQETVSANGYTFEAAREGRVVNNTFIWTSSVLSAHVNVGADTEPDTFMFATNAWLAQDAPEISMPSLPVEEMGSVIGAISPYLTVSADPTAPVQRMYCASGDETFSASPLPEVDGTYLGECRGLADTPTIGPLVNSTGGCTL